MSNDKDNFNVADLSAGILLIPKTPTALFWLISSIRDNNNLFCACSSS